MKTLHFIAPKSDYPSFLTDNSLKPLINKQFNSLLGITTLINLINKEKYNIIVTDENVSKIDFNLKSDLIILTALTTNFNRAVEISSEYLKRNIPTICGGAHVSLLYKSTENHSINAHMQYISNSFTSVVAGEAEAIWPDILNDFENEGLKKSYKNDLKLPLIEIDFDQINKYIDFNNYFTYNIQTTRGCPHDCEFCSVTALNGKKPRHRNVDGIIKEIDKIVANKIDTRLVFFVDDNIIGDKKYAKDLFEKLIEKPITWAGQSSINIAFDDALLKLAAQSGCQYLLLGLESINEDSLDNFHKNINKRFLNDYPTIIHKLRSEGIDVMASFIIGGDCDTKNYFDELINFIIENNIIIFTINILTPFIGTKTYFKMHKMNRTMDAITNDKKLLKDYLSAEDAQHVMFKPQNMSAKELQEGLFYVCEKTYDLKSQFKRIKSVLTDYTLFVKRDTLPKPYINFNGFVRLMIYVFSTLSLKEISGRLWFVVKMILLKFDKNIKGHAIADYIMWGLYLNSFSTRMIKTIKNEIKSKKHDLDIFDNN
jgi:radical SAM superfamily enzyme YgiQ (UPF0313 family)